jgi:hypothetical protein
VKDLLVALVAVFTPVYGPRGGPRWSFNSMLHQEANPGMVAAKAAASRRRCNRPVLTLQDSRTDAFLLTGGALVGGMHDAGKLIR